MSELPPANAHWLRPVQIHAYAGHAAGLRQPSLRVRLAPLSDKSCSRLDQVWAQAPDWTIATGQPGPDAQWHAMPNGLEKAGLWLLHCTTALQHGTGLPVFESGQMTRLGPTTGPATSILLCIPLAPGHAGAGRRAFVAVLALFDEALQSDPGAEPVLALETGPSASNLTTRLRSICQQLAADAPKGANTPRLLRAAFEMDIPVRPLGRDVYQYGYGCRARWFDSTFTQSTSRISVQMARDKAWAASLLRQAGIPVPMHQLVASADAAVQVASRLGFPVVVKPVDLDGGKGVAAGLTSEQDVRSAFERARQHSSRILLEKHVEGRDYRLTVLNGELLWAIERIPGGVTGDARQTIAELVSQVNADPRRGEGAHAPLKRLVLDEEASSLLTHAGLTALSVPKLGQFVPLRRIANVATGGMPVAVNQWVHPDNAQLAVRAAQALRLDLAGVDLLIPDISCSWRQSGAAVCEVNAQPQLGATTGPHLYGEVLKTLLPAGGRIPIALILGAPPGNRLAEQLARELEATGRRVGWSDERGVVIGDQRLTADRVDSFAAGLMLIGSSAVEAVVLSVNDDQLALKGLPFDRYDLLVLAGMAVGGDPSGTTAARQTLMDETLRSALAACTGLVLGIEGSGLDAHRCAGQTTAQLVGVAQAVPDAMALMVGQMRLAHGRRERQ